MRFYVPEKKEGEEKEGGEIEGEEGDDDEFGGSSDEAFESEDERSCASDEEDEDEEDEKEGDEDEEDKKLEDDDMQTLLEDAAETLEEGWDAFYKDGVVYFTGGDQLINGSNEGAIAAHSAKFGKVLWFIPQCEKEIEAEIEDRGVRTGGGGAFELLGLQIRRGPPRSSSKEIRPL
uniref:Uncharacterized protein n=1 Tax=Chromera velia CCMP2878 TaxID=1169474 RepID=A0A0G4F5I2_9ALVE|eukprot:Cvel_15155.t1-p1 / transcript=Cvel_15155.t1 / gene=Cvel_15155 / organism=Chromera_velia_CCMP2878 / gene_product=hypothetical protein / transcript_product=hypothetical protein / location=Cvel_scaffold1106:46052-46670(-) / protein_length=175 / sequence_SO=supercontig / SO=protein_coding / is_pseudo=false